MARALSALTALVLVAARTPAGAVIYVDQNACGEGDNGTSWHDAFHSIQMAIDWAAAGEDKEIWVADGVYVEPGPVTLRDGVALYGGFTGCAEGDESERAKRNPAAAKTIIDADGADHAVVIEKLKGATLDGFVVRKAAKGGVFCARSTGVVLADNEIVDNGGGATVLGAVSSHSMVAGPAGGVQCRDCAVRLVSNRIASNTGMIGGVSLEGGEAILVANTIAHNRAVIGGGIACLSSSPAIVGNLIVDNHAGNGAAVWAHAKASPLLTNNTIIGNKAAKQDQIGGVLLRNDDAIVLNCILWGNGVDVKGGTARRCIIQKGGPDEDNVRSDPLFVNPVKGDYRLKPGSPAIDGGDTAALDKDKYPTDLAGNPRVCDGDGKNGRQVDIGAYEYCPKAE